jgi:hypothetical protein
MSFGIGRQSCPFQNLNEFTSANRFSVHSWRPDKTRSLLERPLSSEAIILINDSHAFNSNKFYILCDAVYTMMVNAEASIGASASTAHAVLNCCAPG